MDLFTQKDMQGAREAIAAMIERSEKAQAKFAPGTSQYTLLRNRIQALERASSLIQREMEHPNTAFEATRADLERAILPVRSLLGKCTKAQEKLAPDTWQHAMLERNRKALTLSMALFHRAFAQVPLDSKLGPGGPE